MWNPEAPLKLLRGMNYLNQKNLEEIQKTIDVDKYINSSSRSRDLCGEYAPFCKNCDKSVKFPCAVAYVRMKQSEGVKIQMDVKKAYESVDAEKYTRIAILKKKK